jgi:hypothetical protein
MPSSEPQPALAKPDREFTLATEDGRIRRWDWAAFRALPSQRISVDLHCVTGWSVLASAWEATAVQQLFGCVEASAWYVVVHFYAGYTTNLPLDDLLEMPTWLAFEGSFTRVTVRTDLNVPGKPAQFGRGRHGQCRPKLIDQFAACLADVVRARAMAAAAELAAAVGDSSTLWPSFHGNQHRRGIAEPVPRPFGVPNQATPLPTRRSASVAGPVFGPRRGAPVNPARRARPTDPGHGRPTRSARRDPARSARRDPARLAGPAGGRSRIGPCPR